MPKNMYEVLFGQSPSPAVPRQASTPQPPIRSQTPARPASMNPMQMMSSVMQAMQNPFGYLKQKFPDIPDELSNNPGGIMQYLQNTRNITDAEVQATANQIPWPNNRS